MSRKVPDFMTDEDAAFLDQDMSDLATAQITTRVPQPLLDSVKDRARARGIPYTRYIRELMERDVKRSTKRTS